MKGHEFVLVGGFCSLLFHLVAYSQESNRPYGKLSVTSNIANIDVFVDSVLVGLTPLDAMHVTTGKHTVCVASEGFRSWMASPVCREVDVTIGEETRLRLDVLRSIQITSEPYGAAIFYRDSLLGETPFIFSTYAEQGIVRVSKDGYENLSLAFDTSTSLLHCSLLPSLGPHNNFASTIYLNKEQSKNILPVAVTASSAVVTGIAAAYFKIRADNLYSDYKTTGNREQLDRIRQLDLASAVALGASQLSLILLTYFLLSR